MSRSSFWSGSDNVWLVVALEPVIQQCIQDDFTCHIAQIMFNVQNSVHCHWNSNIHHDGSQHVQTQHKMLPLKLINLKTCAWFMKNSSSHRALSSSRTFFTRTATWHVGKSQRQTARSQEKQPKESHPHQLDPTLWSGACATLAKCHLSQTWALKHSCHVGQFFERYIWGGQGSGEVMPTLARPTLAKPT